MVEMKILWEGNPISRMKTFENLGCLLCMKERETILKRSMGNPKQIINPRNEAYGACWQKTRFHMYTMNSRDTKPSTDDGENTPERAPGTTSAKADSGISFLNQNRRPLEILQASQAMGITVNV